MDYNTKSVLELKILCKERNIKGISNKNKNCIIDLLKLNDSKNITTTNIINEEIITKNILYNEDCISYMKKLLNESINLTIADPPYYKVVHEKWDNAWRSEEEYLDWINKWMNEVARVSKPTASLYIFGYFRILCKIVPIVENYGFKLRLNQAKPNQHQTQ